MRHLVINFDVISQRVTYFIPALPGHALAYFNNEGINRNWKDVHFHRTKISFLPKYSQKVRFRVTGHIYILYPNQNNLNLRFQAKKNKPVHTNV